MKILHKLITLALTFSLLCSGAVYAAYSDVDYDEDYAASLELLTEPIVPREA